MAIIAMFSDMNKIIFLLKLQKNIFGFQVQQSHQRPEQFFETCSKSQRYGRNLLEFITNPLKKKKKQAESSPEKCSKCPFQTELFYHLMIK